MRRSRSARAIDAFGARLRGDSPGRRAWCAPSGSILSITRRPWGSAAVTRQLALIDDAVSDERVPVSEGVRRRVSAHREPSLALGARCHAPRLRARWLRQSFHGEPSSARRTVAAARRHSERIRRRLIKPVARRSRWMSAGKSPRSGQRVAARCSNMRVRSASGLFFDRVRGRLRGKTDAEPQARRCAEGNVRWLGRRARRDRASRAPWESLLVGFWWARRITKPIYELAVQARVSRRTDAHPHSTCARWARRPRRSDRRALVDKLEETDAALAEHRRRLIQTEKLSAIGELSAKLAHEIPNPLAGMKAAFFSS